MNTTIDALTHARVLVCSQCQRSYPLEQLQTYATCCQRPLLVKYDIPEHFTPDALRNRPATMWRYREMLPVIDDANIVTLGEGMTPLLPLRKSSERFGGIALLLKDEAMNPTGSFKARGLSMAISKARELGVQHCIVPTAGNAGGAMSAYCAQAGIRATVVMPRHTPPLFRQECELFGAAVILVDGLISDCAKKVATMLSQQKELFDLSTLKEPYRLEGKKTMGYEIAEQLHWELPDVILYPTGGGTGLIGIWKAFREMQQMGWIGHRLPRMVAVQAAQCAPVVQAFANGGVVPVGFAPQPSIANGLAVPYPFGKDLILQVLDESQGTAVAVSEAEILAAVKEVAQTEGILLSPEGAAVWKAALILQQQTWLKPGEKVLLLNTGSGYKYMDNIC